MMKKEKGNGPKQWRSADGIVGPMCKKPSDCHETIKLVESYLIDMNFRMNGRQYGLSNNRAAFFFYD